MSSDMVDNNRKNAHPRWKIVAITATESREVRTKINRKKKLNANAPKIAFNTVICCQAVRLD